MYIYIYINMFVYICIYTYKLKINFYFLYIILSRCQNAGRSRSINLDNNSFEKVEQLKYLGTALTNQNSIQEEIKCRLKSGNVYCHSVQNILSSSLLSRN